MTREQNAVGSERAALLASYETSHDFAVGMGEASDVLKHCRDLTLKMRWSKQRVAGHNSIPGDNVVASDDALVHEEHGIHYTIELFRVARQPFKGGDGEHVGFVRAHIAEEPEQSRINPRIVAGNDNGTVG